MSTSKSANGWGGMRKNAGRPKISDSEPIRRFTATVTEPQYRMLAEMGNGKPAEGLRRLLGQKQGEM